jgi:hypothetical protein
MRFCLPKLLIFNILKDNLHVDGYPPDILFALSYQLASKYQIERFSLFNNLQLQCIIFYLEYYLEYDLPKDCSNSDLRKIINAWKQKLKEVLL